MFDLASDMAITAAAAAPRRIGFQFISSIAVPGMSAKSYVLEELKPFGVVMPSDHNEGKYVGLQA